MQAPTSPSLVKHLDHLNLSVRDLDESADWYGRVFGFRQVERDVSNGVDYAILRGGDAMLCIYQRPELAHLDRHARARAGFHGLNHFALRITDREAWRQTVEREQLELHYGGEVNWTHSTAWYVKDPTGYEIEVALWEGDEIHFG